MKIIKTKILIALSFVSLLLLGTNAQAALTSQGSHPELLGSAQCSGGVTGSYALYGNRFGIRIKDDAQIGYHPADIVPKNLGEANIVYIEGHPSASVNGFGSDGMGFYELDGNRYFVGPYYNTRTNSFEFQICWTPIVVAPVYLGNASEDQNASCPPDRPSGYIVQRRSFEVWSDGNRNYSGWYNVADYCSAAYDHTITEDRNTACPGGQLGTIIQRHTYEIWSDGSKRNITAYRFVSSTCSYPPFVVNPTQRTELCPVANTGHIQYKWVVYYTDEHVNVIDADGQNVDIIVTTPHQQEVLDFNSCKPIPTQTLQVKDRISTLSCDEYFGVSGIYLGTVTRVYRDTTIYSSVTQSSTTTSVLISQDATSCQLDPKLEYSFDQNTKPCPAGQTGTMSGTRLVATDSSGKKTYPQGTDYIYTNSTCESPAVAEPDKTVEVTPPTGLLANMSRSSSEFTNAKNTNDFVEAMKNLKNVADEDHKLWFIIDDLRPAYYNKANVSKIIQAHNAASKNRGIYQIDTPMSLDKYIGNGKLKDIKNKYLISAEINSKNEIELVYADSTGKGILDPAAVETLNIPLFDSTVTNLKVK